MKIIAILTIIGVLYLTYFNNRFMYHYSFKEHLIDLGVIEPPKELTNKQYKRKCTLLILNAFFIFFGPIPSAIYLFDNLDVSYFFICSIYILNTITFILSAIASEKQSNSIKYALKHIDIPSSVLEFKIIAFNFVNNEPSYLWDYKRKTGKTCNFYFSDQNDRYRDKTDIQYYFPLYKELFDFKNILKHYHKEQNSPLVNEFILENLTFLTSMLEILRNEKMIKTLSSDLGHKDLIEFSCDFTLLNKNLTQLCQFIKKENETSKANQSNLEMLDTLAEIKSIKSFNKLLK